MTALITLCYLGAGICFILGLRYMGRTASARRGNFLSSLGMFIAVVGAALSIAKQDISQVAVEGAEAAIDFGNYLWIVVGIAAGAIIGVPVARMVKMTAMPEMVALFNGSGGVASLLCCLGILTYPRR